MRYYKLVIVEDEEIIRNGLERYVDWEKCGFQIVATFADGKTALEYIRENPCDVVLTDIMMSVMTGLEMIEKLKEILPAIRVIILSGYDDFSYTRRAIQYKVEDYLLKPIDEEELFMVFAKIKEELDRENDESVTDFWGIKQSDPVDSCIGSDSDSDETECNMVDFYCTALIAALNSGDMVQIERIIDEMMQKIEDIATEKFMVVLKQIYCRIAIEYQRRKLDVIQITNGMFNYNRLSVANGYSNIAMCLKESFRHLCEALQAVKIDYGSDIVTYIMEYVEKHISEELGNDVIAEKCHMHPAYLCRIFKNRTGERLLEYILRVKMKVAVQLLKSGEYNVAEVSERLGYTSSSYFSVQFKKYTGYSPSDYSIRVLEK